MAGMTGGRQSGMLNTSGSSGETNMMNFYGGGDQDGEPQIVGNLS